jgi:SAM-dependent methyltransferase
MNERHLTFLASPEWAEILRVQLLPWLQAADLGDDVLELGPGPGRTTDLLKDCVPRLTAVELDPELAGALTARMAGTGVTVRHADAADTGLEGDRYSAVVSCSMLHHVPSTGQQDGVFREAARVLRPGGRLLVVDALDSEPLRQAHHDDTFVPLDPATIEARLQAAGFAGIQVEVAEDRLRLVASKAGTA